MPDNLPPNPGLCADCVHARVLESARGSRFYLCGLSETDPSFPRYPPLPVLRCAGYTPIPQRFLDEPDDPTRSR